MFELFDRGVERISVALSYAAAVVVAVVFVAIVADVSFRQVGLSPPGLTLTVVEYALLYFAMFSAPWLVRQRGHVCIEALIAILPRRIQLFLAKLVYLLCMLAAAMFAYYSIVLFVEAWVSGDYNIRGIAVPLWLLFLPMPPAFIMVAIEFLLYLIGPRSYYNYDLGEVKDSV